MTTTVGTPERVSEKLWENPPKQQNPANGRAAAGEKQNATSSAGPAMLFVVVWYRYVASTNASHFFVQQYCSMYVLAHREFKTVGYIRV